MSADRAERLRALARDHLEGRSSLESYRRLRARLLDDLIAPAAATSSDATQPRAPASLAEVTQPRASAPQAAVERTAAASSGKHVRSGRIVGYAALGLLLAFAVVAVSWRHHSRRVASPPGAAAASGGPADPIRQLLEPLLQSPDWSDARLLALNEALLEAGQPRLDAARDTDWFDAFVASVRSRLLQKQALAGAPLTPDNSPLAALAVTLGIDLATPPQPAISPTQAQGGSPAHEPRRSGENPGRAQAAVGAARTVGAAGPPGSESERSLPPQSLLPARALPASTGRASVDQAGAGQVSAGHRAAEAAGPLRVKAQSSPGAHPQSAAAAAVALNASASATHREYPACSAALSQTRRNYCQDVLASGDPGPLLAVIPAGSFIMGDSGSPDERPAHRVTLSHAFAMSVYEVSQSEFQRYCRTAGKLCPQQPWTRGDYPVVNVSWDDAQDYARWLSQATHQRYRLPTEAEWEYAARAGRTGLYPSGDSLSPTDAYFSVGQTLTAPAPRSMRFNANAWHLMHMVGNAREWVEDAWSPTFSGAPSDGSARLQGESGIKVVRGGCYADQAIRLRLTTREPLPEDTRDRCTGIRLVRELSP
ncbi:MAG TPA: SUMF1/EgtB/PvdO family nonheme iron enzyme [Steroidobacteraceae bacterium]|nr:SUMF1/EgtB/PvdO family nonheme iron enzyme [Steroidobacteraceae bacterium]